MPLPVQPCHPSVPLSSPPPLHSRSQGAVSKTVTAPLETLKMKLVQGGSVTVVEAARAVLATRGVGGFFAGNTIDVLRTVPSKALELAAFDSYKRTLRQTGWVPDRAIGALAGGLAGITSTVAIYPLETVRTRMAVNGHTFVQTLQRVPAHGGLPGFYRVSRPGGARQERVTVGEHWWALWGPWACTTCRATATALRPHPDMRTRADIDVLGLCHPRAGTGCEPDRHRALHSHPAWVVRRTQVLMEAGDGEGAPGSPGIPGLWGHRR